MPNTAIIMHKSASYYMIILWLLSAKAVMFHDMKTRNVDLRY